MTQHNSISSILFGTNGLNTKLGLEILPWERLAGRLKSSHCGSTVLEKYCSTASSCTCSILGGIHCNMKLSEPLDSKVYLTVQPRSPATGIRNSEYRTCTQINIFNDHESVQVVDIDLKEVSAQVTTHDMANHSIFSTQALPNSLCPPLSYLKSEIQNKP